jgi:hypothetical protein
VNGFVDVPQTASEFIGFDDAAEKQQIYVFRAMKTTNCSMAQLHQRWLTQPLLKMTYSAVCMANQSNANVL